MGVTLDQQKNDQDVKVILNMLLKSDSLNPP